MVKADVLTFERSAEVSSITSGKVKQMIKAMPFHLILRLL